MKLVVLGATGGTGREIVRQALAAGHDVTVLVRRPEALGIEHDRLRVLVGDVRDPDRIDAALDGADAVISSLGIPASGHTRAEVDDSQKVDVCLVSTRLLLEAMPRHGIANIVLMSTHGAGSSNDGSPYVVRVRELVGNRVEDKDRMEELLASTDAPVRWTVLRNPYIYDGPAGRDYGVYEDIVLDDTSRITYADLAAFALAEAEHPRYSGRFLTLTEPMSGERAS